MKKVLLFVSSVLLITCSDDTEPSINYPVIGIWKQVELIRNGVSGKNECNLKNTITFKDDNSWSWLNYNGENCELDSRGAYLGTWMKISETNYEMESSTGETFFMRKENAKIEIQEENDNPITWTFKK